MPRLTIKGLQAQVAARDAHVYKLVQKMERLEEDAEELKHLRATVNESLVSLSRGFGGLPKETLIRQYQAEDELKRIRRLLTQYALDNPGTPTATAMLEILTGHTFTPAPRVDDPKVPL